MFKTYTILTFDEADRIVEQLETLDVWEEGKARTKDLTGTVKQNLEIDRNNSISQSFNKFISQKLHEHADFHKDNMPHKVFGIKFNKYVHNGTYHRHTDASSMHDVRTDLAVTIFLTDPESYDGGELCIEQTDGSIIKHKGQKGDCVVYRCGRPHWVAPVTKGNRICGITWIQSFLRDVHQRNIISSLRKTITTIEKNVEHSNQDCRYRNWMTNLAAIDGELMRMWTD